MEITVRRGITPILIFISYFSMNCNRVRYFDYLFNIFSSAHLLSRPQKNKRVKCIMMFGEFSQGICLFPSKKSIISRFSVCFGCGRLSICGDGNVVMVVVVVVFFIFCTKIFQCCFFQCQVTVSLAHCRKK